MLIRINYLLITLLLSLMISTPLSVVFADTVVTYDLQIREVKVRHDTNAVSDYDEFIEIHNPSSEPVNIGDYTLAYYNVTSPESGRTSVLFALPEGELAPSASIVFARETNTIVDSLALEISSLADSGGRLQLLDGEAVIVSEIAWTNIAANASVDSTPQIVFVCTNSAASCVSRTESLQYDDALATWTLAGPSPVSSALEPISTPDSGAIDEEVPEDTSDTPPPAITLPSGCSDVIINELLSNPAGSDVGNEFIELYNPGPNALVFEGCSLQTTGSSKQYDLSGTDIAAGQYLILPNSLTGLILPNAAGGTVWLLENETELQAVSYDPDLDDNVAWVFMNQSWQWSYVITPGSSNVLLTEKPCAEGYVRNEQSRICEAVVTKAVTVASLAPCRSNQVRNPVTNRCRTVVATRVATLTPCRSDQERNPETNRCRQITSTVGLDPCDEGEERNPETNRCRQVLSATSSTLPPVQDVIAPVASSAPKVALLMSAVLVVMGYAVYEWRRDVVLLGGKLARRFSIIFDHR